MLAGLFSACTVQDIPVPDKDGLITFHAISGEEPETKTVLQSGTLVHWSPRDEIHVFYGNTSGKFVSTNTSVAATADFKGELYGLQRNDNDSFWAVYPYAQEQSFDGSTITLSLPSTQTAVEGTFADDLFISMARSTNTDLRFYNVCGGIKFSVGVEGVKKVVLSGKNNEPLAGRVKVGFDNNLPKVTTVLEAEQSITVNAPDGGTFTPGAWYYLVSLPATLSKGYVMELYGDSLIDTKEGDSLVEILRSVWGVLGDLGGDSSGEDFTGLCIEAIEDGVITINNPYGLNIEYSKDANNWSSSNAKPIKINVSSGDIVRLRGNNPSYAPNFEHYIPVQYNTYTNISTSCDCFIYGNIMSLIDSEGYSTLSVLSEPYAFTCLFMESAHLFNHPSKQLKLPAMTLSQCCYEYMFCGCTSLTIAPALPAMNLANNCYCEMFSDCTALINPPELPANNLKNNCYANMFYGCSSLKRAPALPAMNLAEGCYGNMFGECSSLIQAPALPATTLAGACYDGMFSHCTSLIEAPELPAMNLAENCYLNMFLGCTSLTVAPELPAKTLAYSCYSTMFYECTSLVSAPELPAVNLVDECYDCMFYGCTSLTNAPALPAPVLAKRCYFKMFYGCIKLNSIECRAIDITAPRCTENWVYGVSTSGSFIKDPIMNDWSYGPSGIPEGWTIDTEEFTGLCMEVTEVGEIEITNVLQLTIEYSKDGKTWTASNANPIVIPVSVGDIVRFRGDNPTYYESPNAFTRFLTPSCYIYGNIMSLVDSKEYETLFELKEANTFRNLFYWSSFLFNHPTKDLLLPATILSEHCYDSMFFESHYLTRAPSLPATSLAKGCYFNMFYKCWHLQEAPELPATSLAESCYANMFWGCGLQTAPSLPATTLVEDCYRGMFNECYSLLSAPELPSLSLAPMCYSGMFGKCFSIKVAPELPATSLAPGCYGAMFMNCTGLTSAPELPATTMAQNCYGSMFYGCTNLVTAPELPATTLADGCYGSMFAQCTSLIQAPELPVMKLTDGCYQQMFSGCTNLIIAPELPATILAEACYNYMFSGCSSLIIAPSLPATTLANYCYVGMFNDCISLTQAPSILPATELKQRCYGEMFSGCTSLKTAPELPATSLALGCYGYMFSGCSSLMTAPDLPSTELVTQCYQYMFEGCSNLNYIKALFITDPSDSYYIYNWVQGVASSGTFVKNPEATWDKTGINIGANGIPEGWTVINAE